MTGTSPPFRVLLVGSGEHARESHGPALHALAEDGVQLVAIASPNDQRRLAAAAELNVGRSYRSLAEALDSDEFDGVVIVTPVDQHEPLTLEALARGCHVLCEKPLAPNAATCQRLIAAAECNERTLAVSYQFPWVHPGLREVASAGTLADAYRADLRWTRQAGVPSQPAFWDRPNAGPGEDLLGHLLSVLRVGFPHRIEAASARSWNQLGRRKYGSAFRGHDTLEATLYATGGRSVHAIVSWSLTVSDPELATIVINGPATGVEVALLPAEGEGCPAPIRVLSRGADDVVRGVRMPEPPPLSVGQAFIAQARNWVAAARGVAPLIYPASEALEIQAVLDAVGASARSHGHVIPVAAPATYEEEALRA